MKIVECPFCQKKIVITHRGGDAALFFHIYDSHLARINTAWNTRKCICGRAIYGITELYQHVGRLNYDLAPDYADCLILHINDCLMGLSQGVE